MPVAVFEEAEPEEAEVFVSEEAVLLPEVFEELAVGEGLRDLFEFRHFLFPFSNLIVCIACCLSSEDFSATEELLGRH